MPLLTHNCSMKSPEAVCKGLVNTTFLKEKCVRVFISSALLVVAWDIRHRSRRDDIVDYGIGEDVLGMQENS